VDFRKNDRAPLLLIAGTEDHLSPPSLIQSIYKNYARSTAETTYREFARRSHLIVAQDGWREVAEYALNWAITTTEPAGRVHPSAEASYRNGTQRALRMPSVAKENERGKVEPKDEVERKQEQASEVHARKRKRWRE
jgi:hypothetical protein